MHGARVRVAAGSQLGPLGHPWGGTTLSACVRRRVRLPYGPRICEADWMCYWRKSIVRLTFHDDVKGRWWEVTGYVGSNPTIFTKFIDKCSCGRMVYRYLPLKQRWCGFESRREHTITGSTLIGYEAAWFGTRGMQVRILSSRQNIKNIQIFFEIKHFSYICI